MLLCLWPKTRLAHRVMGWRDTVSLFRSEAFAVTKGTQVCVVVFLPVVFQSTLCFLLSVVLTLVRPSVYSKTQNNNNKKKKNNGIDRRKRDCGR